MRRIGAVLAFLVGVSGAAHADSPEWTTPDPDNILVVDTSKGRLIVEMRPDLAPKAVERIKLLTREHIYDGLLFHRVIDSFVDQTGNPNNKDGGTSSHPNLEPEFTIDLPETSDFVRVSDAIDGMTGFLGAMPVVTVSANESQKKGNGKLKAWGAYCKGVVGMGREPDINTANSEIFFMRVAARRLDHDYTAWGKVLVGLNIVRAIAIGEPPANPDSMVKVQILADMPAADRPRIEIMDTHGAAFDRIIETTRKDRGADFSICDMQVPVRVNGKPE